MKHDIYRWHFEIPLDDIRAEDYDQSLGNENTCVCCGKKLGNPKYFVHLLNSGNLVSSEEDFVESQGFFPIGSSCKNRLPNNFYFKS